MNPVVIIVGFVVLLGVLLYYFQSRGSDSDIMIRLDEDSLDEKKVMKASEYQAQYEKETEELKDIPQDDAIIPVEENN